MANRAFDQTIINVREKPLSSDINQGFSTVYRSVREKWRREVAHRTANGVTTASSHAALAFVGDGFQVQPLSVPAMSVQVIDGIGLAWAPGATATDINGALSCDDREDAKPVALDTTKTIAVPAADAVNPRIDIVEVQYRRQVGNPLSRLVLDIGTRRFVPGLVNKLLTWALGDLVPTVNSAGAINYKTGTPAGVPAAPATTAGYTKIAEVHVAALAASIVGSNIIDLRKQLAPSGVHTIGVKAEFNTTTGAISNVVVSAPPGVLIGLRGLLNFLGSARPALQLLLFVPGEPAAGRLFTSHVEVQQGRTGATSAEGLTPVISNQFVLTGANTVTSLATGAPAAYWPNPSPALPVGAAVFESTAAILGWNSLGPDWLGALPNVVVSWVVEVPVG